MEDRLFGGHDPTVSPFAWQSNKALLFYFTQNSVSEILFVIGVQRCWAFSIISSFGALCNITSSKLNFLTCKKWFLLYFLNAEYLFIYGCESRVGPQPVESSWSRDWTQVPCTGRLILIHCTTREVPSFLFIFSCLFVVSVAIMLTKFFTFLDINPHWYMLLKLFPSLRPTDLKRKITPTFWN